MQSQSVNLVEVISEFIEASKREKMHFDCTVPEEYDRFIDSAHSYAGRMYPNNFFKHTDIINTIKNSPKLSKHPLLYKRYTSIPIESEFVDLENQIDDVDVGSFEDSMSEMEREICKEANRVSTEIDEKIKGMILDGSYLQYSHPEEGEYFVCIPAKYHVAAARAVECEIENLYTHYYSLERRRRPYYTSLTRYNIEKPLKDDPKKVFCTMFYFRFISDPREMRPAVVTRQ